MTTDLPAFVGRYKILQELGRGNFSVVYLAQLNDPGPTQPVALKVLDPASLASQESLDRFWQETRAAAQLEHPGIIQIYDTGAGQEPPFIAMEYVAGETLRERLAGGALPREEAVAIVEQVGAALAHAHAGQVLHGNIKPKNILLDPSQDPARPVLTDFGWVRASERSPNGASPAPSPATLGDSYGYLAPEQWEPEAPLTAAMDIYALAIVLFELLAGRPPFQARVISELRQQHLSEPLPPLSQVAYKLGRFFDPVLARAAAKQPVDRYSNVTDFIQALAAAQAEADRADRVVQQRRARQAVKMAWTYLQKERYDLTRAAALAEKALGQDPESGEAHRLRGEVKLQQERFAEALADYRQAYEQAGQPSSAAGLDYLSALKQAAASFWQRRIDQETARYYHTIKQVLDDGQAAGLSVPAWQEAWTELVAWHYGQGLAAYAEGQPENIDRAVAILEREVGALLALQAAAESQALQDRARSLQVKKYEELAQVAQAAIAAANTQADSIRFNDETMPAHYLKRAAAYQQLVELEPHNPGWPELKEQAGWEYKYYQIQKRIYHGEYLPALDQLVADFIRPGQHEYQDVSKLLWGLVYAKHHAGQFPPEWGPSILDKPASLAPPGQTGQKPASSLDTSLAWARPPEEAEPAAAAAVYPPKAGRRINFNAAVLIVQLLIILTSILIGLVLSNIFF